MSNIFTYIILCFCTEPSINKTVELIDNWISTEDIKLKLTLDEKNGLGFFNEILSSCTKIHNKLLNVLIRCNELLANLKKSPEDKAVELYEDLKLYDIIVQTNINEIIELIEKLGNIEFFTIINDLQARMNNLKSHFVKNYTDIFIPIKNALNALKNLEDNDERVEHMKGIKNIIMVPIERQINELDSFFTVLNNDIYIEIETIMENMKKQKRKKKTGEAGTSTGSGQSTDSEDSDDDESVEEGELTTKQKFERRKKKMEKFLGKIDKGGDKGSHPTGRKYFKKIARQFCEVVLLTSLAIVFFPITVVLTAVTFVFGGPDNAMLFPFMYAAFFMVMFAKTLKV